MHFRNGIRTYRIYGAIYLKWISLGADKFFGEPITEELPAKAGRKQCFTGGKTIYWRSDIGAYEVHGRIRNTYVRHAAEAGPLGFPVSDEKAVTNGAVSYFQHGRIDWKSGDKEGRVTYT